MSSFKLDMDALKNKVKQMKSKNKNSQYIFKPTAGKTTIRIVPYKHNPTNPFIELFFHYNFMNKTFISPVTFNRPDPIDEFSKQLIAQGDKESYKLGKQLEPKLRVYIPVIIRNPENVNDVSFKFWGINKTIYEQLLTSLTDEELGYGNFIDPIEGRDIIVEYKTPKEANNDYGKTTITIKPSITPMLKDNARIKEILSTQPKVEELFEEKTYDEIKTLLEKYCSPDDSKVETKSDIKETDKETTKEVSENDDVDDILSDFDDMINS